MKELLKERLPERIQKILEERYSSFWEKRKDLEKLEQEIKEEGTSSASVQELEEEFEDSETTPQRRREIIRELGEIATLEAVRVLDKWLNNSGYKEKYKEYHKEIVGSLKNIALSNLNFWSRPIPPWPIILRPALIERIKELTGKDIDLPGIIGKRFSRFWWPPSLPNYRTAQRAILSLGDALEESEPELTKEITQALVEIAKAPGPYPDWEWRMPFSPPIGKIGEEKAEKYASIGKEFSFQNWEEWRKNWRSRWNELFQRKYPWRINPFSYLILDIMERAQNKNPHPESQEIIQQAVEELEDYLRTGRYWWRIYPPYWWFYPYWHRYLD
jgi:hypothetical protein